MNQSGANSENGDQQELAAHEEFLELCALSTSGALTGKEQGKLDCHLALCPECSAALRDYQKVVGIGIPSLAPELISDSVAASASASVESAKRRLFEAISIEMEGQSEASPILNASVFAGHQPGVAGRNVAANRTWQPQTLLRYAAALILMIGMAGASYRLGEHRAAVRSSSSEQQPARAPSGLQQEVSALTQEREVLVRGRDFVSSTPSARFLQATGTTSYLVDRLMERAISACNRVMTLRMILLTRAWVSLSGSS